MNEQQQATLDEQKKTWNKVADSWKKWDEFTMNFLKPMGDAIIKTLDIQTNDVFSIGWCPHQPKPAILYNE